jgi:hypothetical protein
MRRFDLPALTNYPTFLGPRHDDVIVVEASDGFCAEYTAKFPTGGQGRIIYDPEFAKALREQSALSIRRTRWRRY